MSHKWINEMRPEDPTLAAIYDAGVASGQDDPPLTEDQIHHLDVIFNGPSIPDRRTA